MIEILDRHFDRLEAQLVNSAHKPTREYWRRRLGLEHIPLDRAVTERDLGAAPE